MVCFIVDNAYIQPETPTSKHPRVSDFAKWDGDESSRTWKIISTGSRNERSLDLSLPYDEKSSCSRPAQSVNEEKVSSSACRSLGNSADSNVFSRASREHQKKKERQF